MIIIITFKVKYHYSKYYYNFLHIFKVKLIIKFGFVWPILKSLVVEKKVVVIRAGSSQKIYKSGQNRVLRKKLPTVNLRNKLPNIAVFTSKIYCDIILDYTIDTG